MQRFLSNTLPAAYIVAFLIGLALMFGSTDVSLFEFVAIIVLTVTGYHLLRKRSLTAIPLTTQNYILGAFFVLVTFQIFLIPETSHTFALASLYLIGVYGLVQFWFKKKPSIRTYVTYGYLAGAILSAVLGLGAYLYALTQTRPIDILFFWGDNIRISVLFDDPVVYGAFLVPAVLLLSTKTFFSTTKQLYLRYGALTLLVFSNLILSGSRGAWLNLLAAGCVLLLLYKPLWSRETLRKIVGLASTAILLACMIIFIIPIGGQSYYEATLGARYSSSDQPRIENLRSTPNRITDRSAAAIIFGSGSGTYELSSENNFSAHNTYLRVLYEQGVAGILFYLLFIVFVLKTAFNKRRTEPLLAVLLIALLIGVLVQCLFVDTLHWRHFWMLIGFVL